MPKIDLLPCPFCGSNAARAYYSEEYGSNLFSCYVECPDCSCRLYDEAEGRFVADAVLAELVKKWNHRAGAASQAHQAPFQAAPPEDGGVFG